LAPCLAANVSVVWKTREKGTSLFARNASNKETRCYTTGTVLTTLHFHPNL